VVTRRPARPIVHRTNLLDSGAQCPSSVLPHVCNVKRGVGLMMGASHHKLSPDSGEDFTTASNLVS
jgi:hypothetical protein